MLGVLPACAAPTVAFVLTGKSRASIALSPNVLLSEKAAAQELKEYLSRVVVFPQ